MPIVRIAPGTNGSPDPYGPTEYNGLHQSTENFEILKNGVIIASNRDDYMNPMTGEYHPGIGQNGWSGTIDGSPTPAGRATVNVPANLEFLDTDIFLYRTYQPGGSYSQGVVKTYQFQILGTKSWWCIQNQLPVDLVAVHGGTPSHNVNYSNGEHWEGEGNPEGNSYPVPIGSGYEAYWGAGDESFPNIFKRGTASGVQFRGSGLNPSPPGATNLTDGDYWVELDFGANNAQIANRLTINPLNDVKVGPSRFRFLGHNGNLANAVTLYESGGGLSSGGQTSLTTQESYNQADAADTEWLFLNSTPFRYYRIVMLQMYYLGSDWGAFYEKIGLWFSKGYEESSYPDNFCIYATEAQTRDRNYTVNSGPHESKAACKANCLSLEVPSCITVFGCEISAFNGEYEEVEEADLPGFAHIAFLKDSATPSQKTLLEFRNDTGNSSGWFLGTYPGNDEFYNPAPFGDIPLSGWKRSGTNLVSRLRVSKTCAPPGSSSISAQSIPSSSRVPSSSSISQPPVASDCPFDAPLPAPVARWVSGTTVEVVAPSIGSQYRLQLQWRSDLTGFTFTTIQTGVIPGSTLQVNLQDKASWHTLRWVF